MKRQYIKSSTTLKGTRDEAKARGLPLYIDGKDCKNGHVPTIRHTHSGWCSKCYDEYAQRRAEAHKEQKAAQAVYKPDIYLRFKQADGEIQIVGPFTSRSGAVQTYKRLYLQEYGTNCPSHLFDETL